MSVSFDFEILDTNVSGISSIMPQNEDAYNYLVEETHHSVFQDGSTVLFDERIGDFISDASHAHLTCQYA